MQNSEMIGLNTCKGVNIQSDNGYILESCAFSLPAFLVL